MSIYTSADINEEDLAFLRRLPPPSTDTRHDHDHDHEPDPECHHCDSMSTRSASPAPSMYSFSSSRDGHVLREFNGRTLNGVCHV